MITKELLISEIEKLPGEYMDILYQIIKSYEKQISDKDWISFIDQTYGCMRDNPIHRGAQGSFDVRNDIR